MTTAHDTDRLRGAELAKIHIAKKQLGLDDEAYELMVWEVSRYFRPDFPVTSSGDMTSAERKALLQKMQSMGAHSGPPKGEKPIFGDSNEPHVRKRYACAYQLNRDGAIAPSNPARWLRKFVKRLTGVEVPRWLTPLDCNKVIRGAQGVASTRGCARRTEGADRDHAKSEGEKRGGSDTGAPCSNRRTAPDGPHGDRFAHTASMALATNRECGDRADQRTRRRCAYRAFEMGLSRREKGTEASDREDRKTRSIDLGGST
jgi:hypothetical protein